MGKAKHAHHNDRMCEWWARRFAPLPTAVSVRPDIGITRLRRERDVLSPLCYACTTSWRITNGASSVCTSPAMISRWSAGKPASVTVAIEP